MADRGVLVCHLITKLYEWSWTVNKSTGERKQDYDFTKNTLKDQYNE